MMRASWPQNGQKRTPSMSGSSRSHPEHTFPTAAPSSACGAAAGAVIPGAASGSRSATASVS